GDAAATAVSRAAQDVRDAGGVRTDSGRRAADAFDRMLRDPANGRNPGTTADLIVASLFVVLMDGGWRPAERVTI
ncbi:MAG TPA: triphosphoribosyl-dephospho-CoA synthase, partial [Vicinamibacterales bacterium]|nr:triphosphoribosyl-dephospho-CoA synthase [Vicinamibacterales bacterium]